MVNNDYIERDNIRQQTLSLLELNCRIKDVICESFPDTYWLRAEMSDVRTNASSGHCYLEFIEKDPKSDQLVARARASIWAKNFRMIKPYFESQTGQLFASGLKVLVKVSVEFHGKMKPADKEAEMQKFVSGKAQILVSTTVIEVGVDVPNASVMVIQSAERFGLSQLHQLRGRVGRGAEQSYCILVSSYKLSNETRKRLEIMVGTNNGFEIAEADLRMRGHETSEILKTKVKLALANGLTPIFCIGEVLEEREAGKHFEVVDTQVKDALFDLSAEDFSKLILAYEPVWAIGTGKTATDDQAEEIHGFGLEEKSIDKITMAKGTMSSRCNSL